MGIEFYNTSHAVHTYECGVNKSLKPECILHWFQEVAESHAELLGFGYHFVMEKQLAWVEIRLDVTIHRMPTWNSEVSIKTWTAPDSALLARRNMDVCDESGQPLITATALWAMIDLKRRRPVPLKKHITDWPDSPCPESVAPVSVDIAGLTPLVRSWTAERRDMDFNQHINNSAYLIWAFEALPDEWLQEHRLTALHVHFKKESHAGNQLCSKTYLTPHATVHHICRGDEVICEVILEWEQAR